MKTPEEIKRAMEGCHMFDRCSGCPYDSRFVTLGCKRRRNADALAYIQQLEMDKSELLEKIEQLKRERDAAVMDLKMYVGCVVCKDYAVAGLGLDDCSGCGYENEMFEWRGVCEENGGVTDG